MLRTSMPSLGARGARRFPSALRTNHTTTPVRSIAQRSFATTRANAKPKTSTGFTFTSNSHPRSSRPQSILERLRSSARFFGSSRARLNATETVGTPGGPAAEPTTLKGKMAKLSREYGWSVVGIYFALSALDFPFCYLLVKAVGVDKIGEIEHTVMSTVKRLIPEAVKQQWRDWRQALRKEEIEHTGNDDFSDGLEMASWGVEEASEANKRDASLATQLALAYAIHKSFIFVRVPFTAAITPKVVKILRGWGWDIGKRTTKEAKALKRAAMPPKPKKN